MRKSDYVTIAATTAGVTGTITVPRGAHLTGLNINYSDADGIITLIMITAPGFPQPLNFMPNLAQAIFTTPGASITLKQSPGIPLDLVNAGGTVISLKAVSSANLTVVLGLEWEE